MLGCLARKPRRNRDLLIALLFFQKQIGLLVQAAKYLRWKEGIAWLAMLSKKCSVHLVLLSPLLVVVLHCNIILKWDREYMEIYV